MLIFPSFTRKLLAISNLLSGLITFLTKQEEENQGSQHVYFCHQWRQLVQHIGEFLKLKAFISYQQCSLFNSLMAAGLPHLGPWLQDLSPGIHPGGYTLSML